MDTETEIWKGRLHKIDEGFASDDNLTTNWHYVTVTSSKHCKPKTKPKTYPSITKSLDDYSFAEDVGRKSFKRKSPKRSAKNMAVIL